MSIACVAAVLVSAAQEKPVFRAAKDEVRVFTTVTDRNGRLVTGLKREQFEIRDAGKAQPITLFDNTGQPIRLIVMLDVSGSMHPRLALLRAAGTQLISRLGAADVARIGTFGNEIKLTPAFTGDPRELAAALPDSIPEFAPTPLWEALDIALNGFEAPADTRKVILVFTDGKVAPAEAASRAVIERARRDDIMIYAVWMRSDSARASVPLAPGGMPMPGVPPPTAAAFPTLSALQYDYPTDFLRVAQDSGGGYIPIEMGQDLGAAFAAVADELHTQYLIGFAPPRRDGKVHDIDVRVKAGGMKTRARRNYIAPQG
jgi:Ca-activated chloride channel family protein